MNRIRKWFKQLFCKHKYQVVATNFVSNDDNDSFICTTETCIKCGKNKIYKYYTGRSTL